MTISIKIKNGFIEAELMYPYPIKCAYCNKDMGFAKSKKGKMIPICKDEQGEWISHFADCPYADKFRKS